MTAEADQIGSARVSLPGFRAYLSSVYDLGRRSIRPALPALTFLFLYRLGVSAYGALTNYSFAMGSVAPGVKVALNVIPILLLVFIYVPFLPLQESLLRGRPIHFLGAIRSVLRVSVNLILSAMVQTLILLGPISPIAFVGARLLPDPFGPLLWIGFAWLLLAAFFMVFAMPAVVLDGEGPLHSLRTSYRLVSGNFWSALGRFRAMAFLAAIAYIAATIPSWILGAAGTNSIAAAAPIKVAVVTWTSAVNTLLFPFWVAAVIVLYRSLRPWTDEGRA